MASPGGYPPTAPIALSKLQHPTWHRQESLDQGSQAPGTQHLNQQPRRNVMEKNGKKRGNWLKWAGHMFRNTSKSTEIRHNKTILFEHRDNSEVKTRIMERSMRSRVIIPENSDNLKKTIEKMRWVSWTSPRSWLVKPYDELPME